MVLEASLVSSLGPRNFFEGPPPQKQLRNTTPTERPLINDICPRYGAPGDTSYHRWVHAYVISNILSRSDLVDGDFVPVSGLARPSFTFDPSI